MQHGKLLLALHQAPSSLERLLAVSKLCVSFLADVLRRSDDTQDIPLLILGHHYLSHRVISESELGSRCLTGAIRFCVYSRHVTVCVSKVVQEYSSPWTQSSM